MMNVETIQGLIEVRMGAQKREDQAGTMAAELALMWLGVRVEDGPHGTKWRSAMPLPYPRPFRPSFSSPSSHNGCSSTAATS